MTDQHDGRTRPFADFLREHNRGRSHEELGESLQMLVARVVETAKKGTLTYVLTVGQGDGGALVVKDEIKLKLPEFDREGSIFYADDDGNLIKNDPRQMTFESLREVPRPTLREDDVDPVTGEVHNATGTDHGDPT